MIKADVLSPDAERCHVAWRFMIKAETARDPQQSPRISLDRSRA
jgi:hypothetical protein